MKQARLIILLLILISPISLQAQTYGNEWINYSQSYYKFQIWEDGVYRLDYNTLSSANIPLSSFQTPNIQIFGKQREIPLFIEDGGDNTFDPGDYILFYAEKNDGWLDSAMYTNPSDIGNPAYSLYNDTLTYFFTWNNSTNNLRFTVETDVNFGAYSNVADYITYNASVFGSSAYHEGVRNKYASSSFYTPGEGWGNNQKNGYATSPNYLPDVLNPSTPFPYTGPGAPNARFTAKSVSNSDAGSGLNHHLRWEFGSSNTIVLDSTWSGYKQINCDVPVSPTLLSNGTTPITMRIVPDLGVATDFQAFQYLNVEYPRQLNFGGANELEFLVSNDPQGKIRLDFSNVGTSNVVAMVFGDTPRIVPFATNGSFLSTLIPNNSSGSDQKVVVMGTSLITDITSITTVNDNNNPNFTDFSVIPDSALLMVYHKNLEPAVNAYYSYRSSTGMSPYMANADELYLQFGGGIPKHIYGIRRFVHYAYDNAAVKPRALFLMGKGIREASINDTSYDGPGTRKNTSYYAQSLIPSYGQPSSDAAITAGLSGASNWKPLIPTGRISAQTSNELQDYLDKVIVYETEQDPNSIYDTPTKDWQKHVLHFAGGSDAIEQSSFQGYMNAMESKISDSLFGASVHRVYKTSSNPLDPTILSEVTNRIAEGVSLMTYFGHATGTNSGFEINLDDPGNWNNQDRYPVMYVNSCYNGNVFQSSISKSEEFVQVANSGAIAYIASVGVGLAPNLNNYSQYLYQNLSTNHYGKTLSELMDFTSENMEGQNINIYNETTCMQMVLNGDPMLRLNYHENPEIEITPDDLSFSPSNLDWTVDSLEIQLNLTNLGQSVTDTFQIEITRSFPNGNGDSLYVFYYPELHHVDTIRFKIPLLPQIALGENIFTVHVDIPSVIPEQYDEVNNNQITKNLLINLDGIVPVIPYEFAVVPEDSVTVKASTTDPIAPFNTYRFEIDTIDFEGTLPQSPEYRYALVSGTGGVKTVDPSQWLSSATGSSMPLVCEDSVVYFWRVAIEGDTIWHESSFQYIAGKTGWGQDHFFQFKDNGFSNIGYDRGPRERNFTPAVVEIESNVGTSTTSPAYFYENNWYIDGVLQEYGIGNLAGRKIHVGWIDYATATPYETGENYGNNYGNFNFNSSTNPNTVWQEFVFLQNDSTQMANFCNFVNNVVPTGDYLLIYTSIETLHSSWNGFDSTLIYTTFENLGSDSITGNQANLPFSFFVRKGYPGTKIEGYAQAGGTFQLLASILGPSDSGVESSPLIGPASNWDNVYWKQDPQEFPTSDTTVLSIMGYDINKVLDTIITQEFTSNDSLINLNLNIDAALYPYISLRASYIDSVDETPSQIDRWHVLYTPIPEAAIDGSSGHYWSAGTDIIQEGDSISFAVDVRNIYTLDMDSLLVDYWVEDENGIRIPINYPRQDSLRVPDLLRDTITFSTLGMSGANSFWMEVNPYINGSFVITDQPEQEHFNNLLQIPFVVAEDDEHPILDVTFDGNHILNGDIINPYGEVLITLKDDNPFLIMDDIADTSLFGIYLTDPTGNQERIPFVDGSGNTVMQWIPADASNLRFQIIWPTRFEMDGTYTLSVQGSDKSGNLSGDLEYLVDFEVIHESTITAMMNYPNPFSTSTRFVFTLTGSEVPDDILIQIMTVSGRVVREISEDELGPINIGRNITEFAWDGTDEFGDPLANGVYLYRVKTRLNGESIEHRESGADQYFTKNFGKMYLLR
ncbi:MAG: C25 family cysteine peptidase [bacterium]|nr:C25 family cysteine peptidase [bacterium]